MQPYGRFDTYQFPEWPDSSDASLFGAPSKHKKRMRDRKGKRRIWKKRERTKIREELNGYVN